MEGNSMRYTALKLSEQSRAKLIIPTVSAYVGLSVTAEILGRKDLKEEVSAEKNLLF